MEALTPVFLNILSHGGPEVVAILIFIIGMLLYDRRRLLHELERKEARIDKIVDDYHQGNITLAEALNSLKMVLVEIKATLR